MASDNETLNDGDDHWPIPSSVDSDQCKIRLTSVQYPTVTATSSTFSIHPAVSRSISISTPTSSMVMDCWNNSDHYPDESERWNAVQSGVFHQWRKRLDHLFQQHRQRWG